MLYFFLFFSTCPSLLYSPSFSFFFSSIFYFLFCEFFSSLLFFALVYFLFYASLLCFPLRYFILLFIRVFSPFFTLVFSLLLHFFFSILRSLFSLPYSSLHYSSLPERSYIGSIATELLFEITYYRARLRGFVGDRHEQLLVEACSCSCSTHQVSLSAPFLRLTVFETTDEKTNEPILLLGMWCSRRCAHLSKKS